ncbi:MAG: TraR/DksA C4-type zinc finger protein [Patescibacteria group bacterium]
MKTRFFEEMKTALAVEKSKLEAELAGLSHRKPQTGQNDAFAVQDDNFGSSEDENASEIAQFGDNLSLEQELESGLKDVESALKAVDAGTYGVCKYCKQNIAEDRLRARPTSTSCIACKKTLTQEV